MTNKEFIESVSLEGEIWKDVVGYEGMYMVSSFGRLISLGRWILQFHKHIYKSPIVMSDTSTQDRYNRVVLKVDGTKKSVDVHRLVAQAFISNPNNYRCIDHIDGDKTNNNVSNLRWCTDKQNQNNLITREKQRKTLISKKSKFAPKSIVGIKDGIVILRYDTMCEAKKDGFNQSMISECCNGKRKHHHGYEWAYSLDYELNTN